MIPEFFGLPGLCQSHKKRDLGMIPERDLRMIPERDLGMIPKRDSGIIPKFFGMWMTQGTGSERQECPWNLFLSIKSQEKRADVGKLRHSRRKPDAGGSRGGNSGIKSWMCWIEGEVWDSWEEAAVGNPDSGKRDPEIPSNPFGRRRQSLKFLLSLRIELGSMETSLPAFLRFGKELEPPKSRISAHSLLQIPRFYPGSLQIRA